MSNKDTVKTVESAWSLMLGDEEFDEESSSVRISAPNFVLATLQKKQASSSSLNYTHELQKQRSAMLEEIFDEDDNLEEEEDARPAEKPKLLTPIPLKLEYVPPPTDDDWEEIERLSSEAEKQRKPLAFPKSPSRPTSVASSSRSNSMTDIEHAESKQSQADGELANVAALSEEVADKHIPVKLEADTKSPVSSDDDLADIAAMADDADKERIPLKLGEDDATPTATIKLNREDVARKISQSLAFAEQKGNTAKELKEMVKHVHEEVQRKPSAAIKPAGHALKRDSAPQQPQQKFFQKPETPKQKIFVKQETKDQLSKDQLNDLESFLNDDAFQSEKEESAQYVFGSFLAPNAISLASKAQDKRVQHLQASPAAIPNRRESRLQPVQANLVPIIEAQKTELDFSYGQELPVTNWGSIILQHKDTLERISFSSNALTSAPIQLTKLPKLKRLDLGSNKFATFPDAISGLILEELDLRINKLTTFNGEFPQCQKLILHMNVINQVVFDDKMRSLTELDMSCNNLSVFPEALLHLANVKILNLSGNKIRIIHHDLSSMSSLRKISLADNELENFPIGLEHLGHLEKLDLSNNVIQKITSPLECLVTVRELYIQNNEISELPSGAGSMRQLEILDLRGNSIENLPPSLGKLTMLDTLLVDMKGSLKLPPRDICSKGTSHILNFLKDVLKGTADASLTIVFGSGLAKNCVACETEQFTIKAVDKYGNQKRSGGDKFEIDMERVGGEKKDVAQLAALDQQNGSYMVEYDARRAGMYLIHVKVEGQHLPNSPFAVEIEPAGVHIPGTKCKGEGLLRCFAGIEQHFTVQLHDKYGNPCKCGGQAVRCFVAGSPNEASSFKCHVVDLENGSYEVYYVETKAGSLSLMISVDGEDVRNHPFNVNVSAGEIFPGSCKLSATGTNIAEVNVRTSFVIQSNDRYGNRRFNSDDTFFVTLHGSEVNIEAEVASNGEVGEYYASYTLPLTGRYRVEVKGKVGAELQHVAGSPFELFASDNQEARLLRFQTENIDLANALAEANKRNLDLLEQLKILQQKPSDSEMKGSATMPQMHASLSCEEGKETELIAHLVGDFSSEMIFAQPLAGYIAFEAALHRLLSSQEDAAQKLLSSFIKSIGEIASNKNESDAERLILWLQNSLYLKQRVASFSLSNFSDINVELSNLIDALYRASIKTVQNSLSPVIVNAFLDPPVPQSRGYFQSLKRRTSASLRFKSALESVLLVLTQTFCTCQKFCIDPSLVQQFFCQIYRFIDSILLNSLLLRKNICDQENAQKIRTNLQPLEDWIKENQLDLGTPLLHIKSATNLLRLPLEKMSIDDTEAISKTCPHLNFQQTDKLLRNSSEKLTEDFVSAIVAKIQERDPNEVQTGRNQVFLDTFFVESLHLEETPADLVNLPRHLQIPFIQRLLK